MICRQFIHQYVLEQGCYQLSYKKAADQYRKSAVSNASPLELIIMLYDGALRFMEAAKHHMAEGQIYEQNRYCLKAQDILTELLSCLDTSKGGEMAQNLFALYEFAYNSLVEANISQNPRKIDEAMEVLSRLRTSWAEVAEQAKGSTVEQNAA